MTSCLYPVTEDAEIVLPEKPENKVLTAQYRYSGQLDPDPGEHLRISSRSTGMVIDVGAFTGEKTLRAAELQLSCNPDGLVKILPSLSAYVGADIVAGIATLATQKDHQNFLFVDIRTNGEIALITLHTIYFCAAASGPAFEGANIEFGMTATEGAIMRYYESGNFQVIGDVRPVGLCGSGLIDVVASLVRTLTIPADGHMEETIIVVSGEESGTSQDIYLTPKDIREV